MFVYLIDVNNYKEMPKVRFKNQPGNTPELFPSNIFDKIPDTHPVKLVNEVVDKLDLSVIISQYKRGGVQYITQE